MATMNKFFTTVSLVLSLMLSLFQSETFAAPLCQNLFYTNSFSGAQFLHERDSKLHVSSQVERIARQHKNSTNVTLTEPADKINVWLEFLNRLSAKADTSPRTESLIKESLYQKFIIQKKNIPESYYNQQVQIARERGHGDIRLTETQKQDMAEVIIADQKTSMDSWTEYLISKDTRMYPMWLKYWMFSGMTKLSKYNAQTGSFGNRSESTVSPFPELNREALAYLADAVVKKLNKQSLTEIADPKFLNFLNNMNFGKLYGRTLFNLRMSKDTQFNTTEGRWVIYPQGSDHMLLVNSLKDRNTGWCTASEGTAKAQLTNGDFHVYYSLDQNGQATIPRVGIRMENDKIAEVRGVAKSQNLDTQISQSPIVTDKMKEFGDKGKNFEKKDHHMKYLTQIEVKNKLGQSLTVEELKFLYEIDHKIEGFGYSKDPRIKEIKNTRDLKSDYVAIYHDKYARDEISNSFEDVLNGKAKVYIGDIFIYDINMFTFKLPEILHGNLTLPHDTIETLILPIIYGDARFPNLRYAKVLKFSQIMYGDISLPYLTSAKGVQFPKILYGDIFLGSIKLSKGLILPKILHGSLTLLTLRSAHGLIKPKGVTKYEGPDFSSPSDHPLSKYWPFNLFIR